MTTRDEQIRLIAYQIWEEEGRPHGKHVEHWIQAERRWSQMNRSSGNDGGGRVAVAARPAAPAIRQPTPSTPEPARAARPAPRAATNSPESEKKGEQARSPRPRRPEK